MTLEELQAQNAELQKALADAKGSSLADEERERLKKLETEHKELIEARDKAKAKARQEEEDRLKAQGEYKTLAEQRAADLEAARLEKEGLAGEIAKYKERDEKELAELVKSVPENLKGLITDDLPLSKRLEMARAFSATKPNAPGFRAPGEPTAKTIREQYDEAMKAGNMPAAISLKRQLFEKKE